MAEFICRLGTPAGEVVTRTVEARACTKRARASNAKASVSSTSRRPRPPASPLLTRFGRRGAHPRVKANDFLLFNQQLAALVRAGIPILQAISMLRKRAASARLRTVLGEVEEQIRGGAALSQAFAAQGSIFPRIYTASILAGERSGALDEVLESLRHLHATQRRAAPKDSRRTGVSDVSAVCFGVHGHVSDCLRRAENVGTVCRIWQRIADRHADRGGTFALAVVKRDLVWSTGYRRLGRCCFSGRARLRAN